MPNIEFVLRDTLSGADPTPHEYVCRGRFGCGTILLDVDRDQHKKFHERQGDPVDLSDLSGTNDPGPIPPRG